jgi:hypothetical protein
VKFNETSIHCIEKNIMNLHRPVPSRLIHTLVILGTYTFSLLVNVYLTRADMTIDSFEDADGPIYAGNNYVSSTIPRTFPHVIAGRSMELAGGTGSTGVISDIFPQDFPQQVEATITSANDSSFLEYTDLTGSASGTLTLSYGLPGIFSSDGTPSPDLLGLTINPNTSFLQLTFLTYNHANNQDLFLGTILNPDEPSETLSLLTSITSSGPQQLDIPLNGLTTTTLNSLTFHFGAPAGTTFELDSISLITQTPEPASLSVLVLSVLTLHRRPKRLQCRSTKF